MIAAKEKGNPFLASPQNLIAARPGVLASLAAARLLPGRYRSNDSLEIRVRSGPAMDRHMQGDIQSQPLDGVVQHNCASADISRRRRARSWRAPEIGVDQNLLLREIDGQHVFVVIKPRNVKNQHGLLSVADRVALRDRLDRERTGAGGREWEWRKP